MLLVVILTSSQPARAGGIEHVDLVALGSVSIEIDLPVSHSVTQSQLATPPGFKGAGTRAPVRRRAPLLINLGAGLPVPADHTNNGCLIHLFPSRRNFGCRLPSGQQRDPAWWRSEPWNRLPN